MAIPHYFATAAEARYGSERSGAAKRGAVLTRCLYALHHLFGPSQGFISGMHRANGAAAELRVVVCTDGEHHALEHVPGHLYEQGVAQGDPRYLGYACHEVLAERAGDFDFLVYLEDDILLSDPMTFLKTQWFVEAFGEDKVLQPQRFEQGDIRQPVKLYIDGYLRGEFATDRFQDIGDEPTIRSRQIGQDLAFIRFQNPHSGAFFLTSRQMRHWMRQPCFLDRSDVWVGPPESAATLGLMRTFKVYKPALKNACFFEVEHLDHRHLNHAIREAPDPA